MTQVTVIIPTFNLARVITKALDSVLAQSLQDFEILIVDDGSTDQTQSVVEPYLRDRRIKFVYQENRGMSGARNRGIMLSSTKFIAFLDADDAFEPEALSILTAALEQEQQAAWCTTDVVWVT